MKINYKPNPLETTIELNDHDIEILRLKITIEQLQERIYEAHFRLEPKYFNVEEAIKALDAESIDSEEFQKEVNRQLEWTVEALKDIHVGDCTCVPCSCLKCHSEEILGVNTIKGLGKHSAYKINDALKDRTVDEGIEYLENYNPVRSGSWLTLPEEDFNRYVPRWKDEARHAAKWLKEYKETYLDQ